MPALSDRVRETSTTTGTGTFSLAGAVTGFVSFSSAFGNGVSVYYVAALGAEWEIGIGTTGAGTLSRDTVIASSAGGTTKVTFSAGAKDVFCSIPAVGLVTTDDVASTNTANKVVKRDGSGNFAAGTITANLTGNVSGSSGSTTGNAATATALQTARNINGVSFNGTADITVAAAAGTLTGNTLASGVTASSLTSVGTLTSLTVTNASSAAPFAVNSNNANAVYYDLTNAQNSGSFRLAVYGTTAFGVAALVSRAAVEGTTPNGLVVGAVTSGANGGPIEFQTGFRVLRWSIGASTGHLLAGVDNTYDIGASGATRPRNVFVGTAVTTPSVTNAGTLALSATGANVITAATNGVERMRVTSAGNVVAGGSAALATNATDGFLYVPTCAGTPTGTPTAITGMAPVVVDTTNNKFYFYSGAQWRDAGP
jgi:hypothetical protein